MPKTLISIPESDKLPDHKQWINRFIVRSRDSGTVYTISQHRDKRFWSCSCTGCVIHKNCKHLRALDLPVGQTPHECVIDVVKATVVAVSVPVVGAVEDFTEERTRRIIRAKN